MSEEAKASDEWKRLVALDKFRLDQKKALRESRQLDVAQDIELAKSMQLADDMEAAELKKRSLCKPTMAEILKALEIDDPSEVVLH